MRFLPAGWVDSIMARVQVEDYPSHAAFSATQNKLYVSRTDTGSLVVIDGSADAVVAGGYFIYLGLTILLR